MALVEEQVGILLVSNFLVSHAAAEHPYVHVAVAHELQELQVPTFSNVIVISVLLLK